MDGATKGALSELTATIDLWRRGFEVYRNLSPTGPTDLMVTKQLDSGRVLIAFVQVKSCSAGVTEAEKGHNDIVAVAKDGMVRYKVTPGLIEHFSDALIGTKPLDKKDSFAIVFHSNVEDYRIDMTYDHKQQAYKIQLFQKDMEPSFPFLLACPEKDRFVVKKKLDIIKSQILAESKTSQQLRDLFSKFRERLFY